MNYRIIVLLLLSIAICLVIFRENIKGKKGLKEYFDANSLSNNTFNNLSGNISSSASDMPPLFNCNKYPDLCYSSQYINNKFRPYMSARKEYYPTLERMKLENESTYQQRLLDELAKQNKIKEYWLWYDRFKKGKLITTTKCKRDHFLRRKCKTHHTYVDKF